MTCGACRASGANEAGHEDVERLVRGGDGIHQAEGLGLRGAEHLGPAEHRQSPRRPKQAHEVDATPPGRGDVELALDEADAGVGCRDAEVAGHGQLGAAAQGNAVERGHHRHREPPDRVERGAGPRGHGGGALARSDSGQIAQVTARGEAMAAGRREHDHAQRLVGRVPREDLTELVEDGAAERIALLRPVDRDPEDAVGGCDEHGAAHPAASSVCRAATNAAAWRSR
jgi:hypothetical protein